jgi:hypothetical protein
MVLVALDFVSVAWGPRWLNELEPLATFHLLFFFVMMAAGGNVHGADWPQEVVAIFVAFLVYSFLAFLVLKSMSRLRASAARR